MIKATDLSIGKEFCPGYRLRRLLGRGGHGHVWEADAHGKAVALKFLPCGDNSIAAKEIRSIQVMRQLQHAHLVRIDQLWCHRGHIVITMEMADGSLLDLLEAYRIELGTPIPADQVCDYLIQAAAAIDFLNTRQHLVHDQYVALQHGDIKPSNLLLFGETVKLCDFGLAALALDPLKNHQRGGTMDYAAPEVFQGRISSWTDQYALAVTYCHLRGGRLPFAGSPRHTEPPDLSMLPEAERPAIARGLAPVSLERWPSCAELMYQLRQAIC